MTTMDAQLGPFAPDRGERSRAGVLGAMLAGSAVVALLTRVLLDRGGGDHGVLGRAASYLAVAAAVSSIIGAFEIATRGRRGRSLVKASLGVAVVAALTAAVYAAAHDGSLRLDRIADWFDLDLWGAIAGSLVRGAVNTLKLAAVSEVLAIVLGLAVALLRLSPRPWIRLPAVWYVDTIRATPLLVLIALVYAGLAYLGIGLTAFQASAVALMLNAGAYVGEIFRAGIQAIPRGQMDAARSLGMRHSMSMLYVVVPQAARNVIPPLMSEYIALAKDTAIVLSFTGFTVASADLFGAARTAAASSFSFAPYVAATLGYWIILLPLIRVVDFLERRARAGLA